MIAKSEAYYRRFPSDRARVAELSERCAAGDVSLPNGDIVSPDRFRTIGHRLGASGGAEVLHYLFELDHRSSMFSHDLAALLPFAGRNPIYSVLHESSYADGVATRWSADRTMPDRVRNDPTLFGGEHLHRSLFTEDSELAPFAEAADLLAEHEWPRLYDEAVLAGVDVPCAAAIYVDDPFILREHSMQTAQLLPTLRPWITNELLHNGLRTHGDALLDRLIGMARGGW